MSETADTRDPVALVRGVVLWLRLYAVSLGLSLIATLYAIKELRQLDPNWVLGSVGVPELAGSETAFATVASLPEMILFIISGVLTLRWIYFTNRNAHALSQDMITSPGWAVGWFFIPIACLWKPYEGVRQTWQVSNDADRWTDVAVPAVFRWWWGLWIATSILSSASFRVSLEFGDVRGNLIASYLDVACYALSIPLCFVLIRLVRRVSEAQAAALRVQAFT